MSRFRSALKRDIGLGEVEINLTPLIDVVFVVLIIFIIIAPMLEIDRVELASGPNIKQEKNSPESSNLSIHVREDNSIWFAGRQVSAKELMTLLKIKREKEGAKIPQLFHDKKASFGTYQIVKNAVEEAGYAQMDVILKPQ
jgi:biopolymer transport protein ExbD